MTDPAAALARDHARMRLLSSAFSALANGRANADELITSLCRDVGEALGDECHIYLQSGPDAPLECSARWPLPLEGHAPATPSAELLRALSRTRPAESGPSLAPSDGDEIVAPLGGDGPPIGAICLRRNGAPQGPFDDEDLKSIEDLARLLTHAIENARVRQVWRDAQAARHRDEAAQADAQRLLDKTEKLESMGRLAGTVAHDFNNLLAVMVSSSAALLTQIPADSEFIPQISAIRDAATRAASLTRQLLVFSRQQVLAPRIIDPYALIADLEQMIRPVIGEDIELSVVARPSDWRIFADRSQLELALVNLVVNARDAMPNGGHLAVTCESVTLGAAAVEAYGGIAPGDFIHLSITDTGDGIPLEVRDRIFEPFFTTKDRRGGTGLGLPTTLGVVQQSGGAIRFDSELGRGTTFDLILPRYIAQRQTPKASRSPAATD